MRRLSLVLSLLAVVAGLSGALAIGQTVPVITGSLSNFDVVNPDECCYNDFELYVHPFDCKCILGWYPGWGVPPEIVHDPVFDTCVVRWRGTETDCVPQGKDVHFGLAISEDCRAPTCLRAYWTWNGIPMREMPIPWQFWSTRPGAVVDVVSLNQCCKPRSETWLPSWRGLLAIRREVLLLRRPVPLPTMVWPRPGEPEISREWEPLGDWMPAERFSPIDATEGGWELLGPDHDSEPLIIPVEEGVGAVLVRYEVQYLYEGCSDPNLQRLEGPLLRFINQAILAPASIPSSDLNRGS